MAKEIRKLSDLANIFSGNSIPKKKKEDLFCGLDIGTPYVATKDVGLDYTIHYENGVLIPETHTDSFKLAPANSVLICAEGGSAGKKVAHNDRDIHFVNKLFCVHPSEEIISKYIFYYFLSADFKLDFNNQLTGLIGGVSLKKFKNLSIPYTSLEEQKRIVLLLDAVFEELEQARALTEKNLKNARELFDSYMQQVFSQKGESWTSVKLKDICSKITDGVHKKPNYIDEGVPFLKINNLTVGTGISFKNTSYISKEDHELFCKRANPEKGDILISKDGTIGIVRIIDTDIEFSIFVSLALVKPIDKSISHYLKFVLESPDIQGQIQPQGAALKHLYLRDLREFSIPVAPASEQEEIVKKLDFMKNRVECLEKNYQCKLNAIDELKKSILQKAFSGELTTTT